MISNEDFECITALDDKRSKHIEQYPDQCAKTLINLLTHVSKDQTIQYVLVLIDDILQEDRARVEMFISYGIKRKESIWSPFLNLLNRQDGFIVNMSANILAKLACCGSEQMNKADLNFYLQWLKDQLTNQVSGADSVDGVGRSQQSERVWETKCPEETEFRHSALTWMVVVVVVVVRYTLYLVIVK